MTGGSLRTVMTVARSEEAADAGWTLIELLVALVLMSLLTVLLMSSVYSSRRAIEQLQVRDGEMSVEIVENYLRHAISETQPIKSADSGPNAPLIEGNREQLRLITSYAPAGQFGGLYVLNLQRSLNARNRNYDLVETRTLHRPQLEPGAPEPARPSVRSRLLRNVGNISFRYFGALDELKAPDWVEAWTDPTRLPQLIEIRVRFLSGDDRSWSPLIVALPVGR